MNVSVASSYFHSGVGVGVGVRAPLHPSVGRVSDSLQGLGQARVCVAPVYPSVCHVCTLASSSFSSSSLLFPSSDSGFVSCPSAVPFSTSLLSLPFSYSSSVTLSSLAPSVPSAPLPIFSLPSVVPSVLSPSSYFSSSSLPSSAQSSLPSFSAPPSISGPPPPLSSASLPFFSTPSVSSTPVQPPPGFSALPSAPITPAPLLLLFLPSLSLLSPRLCLLWGSSSWFSSSPLAAFHGCSCLHSFFCGFPFFFGFVSMGDLADFQARVLGLSAEYQTLGRWFVASGGLDFCSYIASHCPHLYSDFRSHFASGSSRLLAALASASSLPPPSSSAPLSVSSSAVPVPLPVASLPPVSSVPSASALFSASAAVPLPAPRPFSLAPSAAAPPPPVFFHPSFSLVSGVSWLGVSAPGPFALAPGVSAAPISFSPSLHPPAAPSLFRPFAADPVPSAPAPPSSFSPTFPSAPAAPDFAHAPASSTSFMASDDLLVGAAPDALPHDDDSAVCAAVPDSVCSEFRRMLAFLVDLFPQAAGSHSSAPPLARALFKDFFSSSTPHSPSIFLSWFERVRTALSDADFRLSAFLSSGRSDFSFLPPRNSSYAVEDEFASGQAVPVNLSLLSLYEKQLKPSYHVGLSVHEAAALESSLRCQLEALSHSMWVLSGLLGFVRLQTFAPFVATLFKTLVTSLSRSLTHQASLCTSHIVFLVLKRRHFYLSHLPAYFSDSNKRAMLSAPAVCSDFLFVEADVARLWLPRRLLLP